MKKRVSLSSAARICCMYQCARSLSHSGQSALVVGSPVSPSPVDSMSSVASWSVVTTYVADSSRTSRWPFEQTHISTPSTGSLFIIDPHSSQNSILCTLGHSGVRKNTAITRSKYFARHRLSSVVSPAIGTNSLVTKVTPTSLCPIDLPLTF